MGENGYECHIRAMKIQFRAWLSSSHMRYSGGSSSFSLSSCVWRLSHPFLIARTSLTILDECKGKHVRRGPTLPAQKSVGNILDTEHPGSHVLFLLPLRSHKSAFGLWKVEDWMDLYITGEIVIILRKWIHLRGGNQTSGPVLDPS